MVCRNYIKDKVNGKCMVLHTWNSDDSTADHVSGETVRPSSLPHYLRRFYVALVTYDDVMTQFSPHGMLPFVREL